MGPPLKTPKSSNWSRKNKKYLYPSFQSLTSIDRRQTNRSTRPRLLQCKQKVGGEVDQQTTKRGGARDVVRARRGARFQRAMSPSWRHAFTGLSSKPLSVPDQPIRHRKQIHNNPRKPAILSASLTLSRLASSPQVIENKNTIEMSESRGSKPGETPCKHGIS